MPASIRALSEQKLNHDWPPLLQHLHEAAEGAATAVEALETLCVMTGWQDAALVHAYSAAFTALGQIDDYGVAKLAAGWGVS